MVDLSSGGPDGPLEHGFSNSVFVFPGIVIAGLVVSNKKSMDAGGFEVPQDPQQLLQWVDQMSGISEEDREALRQSILMGGGLVPESEEPVDPGINVNAEQLLLRVLWFMAIFAIGMMMLASGVSFVFVLL